jgi:hypothetical protein
MDFPASYSQFSAQIDGVAARLAEARLHCSEDLGGLETQVDELCQHLEAAPRGDARTQLPALQKLLLDLDLLAIDLENATRQSL